jgi:hypothetical protein
MPTNVQVVELSPLKAATVVWRPAGRSPVLTVVCKATYALEQGESPLADVQDDVNERDLHAMNNPSLGLHSASDLVPFKQAADVTLVGKAYAPPGELSRALIARIRVGSVDKRVQIHADRLLSSRSGRVRDEKFFSKMALGYELAPGGKGTQNPAGRSLRDEPNDKGYVQLPNIQHPEDKLSGPDSELRPIGFGPIPSQWPSRRARINGQEGPWLKGDFTAAELPADWDWGFYNVAPRDQQLVEIRPDQAITLEHLHPAEAKLETVLPGLRPVVYVERASGARRLEVKGDTLWIDTNRLVQTVTWRGQIAIESLEESLRVVVSMAKPGADLTWEAAWHLAEAKLNHEADDEDQKKTIARAPRSIRGIPARPNTKPVPLMPSSDHTPGWVPSAPSSNSDAASGPGGLSPVPGPVSSGAPPGSGLMMQVALSEEETAMLRDLCKAMGYDADDMLKYLLIEAHNARFGGSSA